MSSAPLERLVIEFLRGSTVPFTLSFEKGKKLTIVYGENGTGKSTICDALEFLGQGRVGSLENRGLGKTGRYWQSVAKKSLRNALLVEIIDHKPGWYVELSGETPHANTRRIDAHRTSSQRLWRHFSKLSFDMLDSDGLKLGLKVLELIDTLADSDADWPRNAKSGKYWANSGETRRLHPLKQPV